MSWSGWTGGCWGSCRGTVNSIFPPQPLLPHPESLISCRWATAAESLQLLSLWQISGIRGGSKVFLGLSVADTTMAAYGRRGPLQATLLTTNFSVSPGLGVYGQVNEALCEHTETKHPSLRNSLYKILGQCGPWSLPWHVAVLRTTTCQS